MVNKDERTITSVGNSFTIIRSLSMRGPQRLSELAGTIDMPKSTVHIHLQTLLEQGYITRHGDEYDLGLKFLETGSIARRRRAIYYAARDEVDNLARDTEEAAHLGVEEDGQRVILYKSEAGNAVYDNTPTGEFTNMHWTAIGKVLLAHFPQWRAEEIIDEHGLPKATESTIVNRDRLFDDFERIREQGFAIEDEERREGVLSVAFPVFDIDANEIMAAMSVSGPRQRLTEDGTDEVRTDVIDAVRNRANVAKLRFNHY